MILEIVLRYLHEHHPYLQATYVDNSEGHNYIRAKNPSKSMVWIYEREEQGIPMLSIELYQYATNRQRGINLIEFDVDLRDPNSLKKLIEIVNTAH